MDLPLRKNIKIIMDKKLTLAECIKKTSKINEELIELGYDWEFIETFWKDCAKTAKENHDKIYHLEGTEVTC